MLVCPQCGKEFVGYNGIKKFCSIYCKKKNYNPKTSKEAKRKARQKWFEKNKNNEEFQKRQTEIKTKTKDRNREFIRSLKENRACQDCGNFFHWTAMDFDHRGDKIISISTMSVSSYSIEKILNEVNKCDLVCSNCHRVRTYQRGVLNGSWHP